MQALVALALVRPIEQLDELVPGEIHLYVLEVVPQLGQVDQGDDHVRIGGGRQAVSVAAGDGEPPVPILEIEGFLPLGSVVCEQGDGELGQVHLVPADERDGGDRLGLGDGVGGCHGYTIYELKRQKNNNLMLKAGGRGLLLVSKVKQSCKVAG